MRYHRLKINSRFFKEVYDLKKNFEIRFDDRQFKVGDYLILQEITETPEGSFEYTGGEIVATISYILRAEDFPAGLKEEYVILSIKVISATLGESE